MRTHISKALQSRSKAIRAAVQAYNTAARALDPPRDTLDWQKVTHFSFIDQFDILRDTRHSVLDKPWAKPLNRELMMTLHRVARAQEEIQRLNVEIRRLHTRIVDENAHFDAILEGLKGRPMHGPVLDYISRRRAVDKTLLSQIQSTYALQGFSGIPTVGITKHPFPPIPELQPPKDTGINRPELPSAANEHGLQLQEGLGDGDGDDDGHLEDEDEYTDNVRAVVDFIANLAV